MKAADWLADVSSIADALSGLLDRETALLDQMKVAQIEGLQEQKQILAGRFEAQVRRLAREPDFARALDPAKKADFAERYRRLTCVMQNNEQAIRAARAASEGLFKAFVAATRSERGTVGYTGRGAVAAAARREVVSISLDRRL
jgi:flagellar biosynthesis/type III secretory pathway chaperone